MSFYVFCTAWCSDDISCTTGGTEISSLSHKCIYKCRSKLLYIYISYPILYAPASIRDFLSLLSNNQQFLGEIKIVS